MSIFFFMMVAIVLLVGFFHYVQGLFSATISAILAIFAAVLAVSFHESIVSRLLGGKFADMAHGMVLLVSFAAFYLVPRVLFDHAVPGNIRLPAVADKVGGAVMGLVAGVFAAGIVAIAAQEMPFYPSVAGYARYAVETRTGLSVPTKAGRNADRSAYDLLNPDGLESPSTRRDAPRESLLLPVDDIVVGTVRRLSDGGALAGDRPLTQVHPDWLFELFGQRMGIEPGAKRVAMITADGKTTDVRVEGVYRLDPAKLEQRDGEAKQVRPSPRSLPFKFEDGGDASRRMLVAVRTLFGTSAKDLDNLIRFSPGSVRLVTQAKGADGQLGPAEYFPIGTLDDAKTLYLTRLDDFLFLNDAADRENTKESERDQGADLVFYVEKDGFATAGGKGQPAKITAGTFLEVKRMAQIDLSGQDVKASGPKASRQINVLRKPSVLKQGKEEVVPPVTPPAGDQPATPTPGPKPDGTPPTPTPPTPAAAGDLSPLGQRLQGTWQTPGGGVVVTMTFAGKKGTLEKRSPIGLSTKTEGTWTEKASEGDTITILRDYTSQGGQATNDEVKITLQSDTNILVTDAGGPLSLNKK